MPRLEPSYSLKDALHGDLLLRMGKHVTELNRSLAQGFAGESENTPNKKNPGFTFPAGIVPYVRKSGRTLIDIDSRLLRSTSPNDGTR